MPSSKLQSIDHLLGRARQGSRSALNELMERSRPELLRKARARLTGRLARKQDAEDVVQECQFEATARFDEFRSMSLTGFRRWVSSILDNKILHYQRHLRRRKQDRKREEPLPTSNGVHDVLAGSTTSILGRLAREEDLDQLKVAMGWCRQEDRDVIVRHLFEDRTHDQIAAEWGIKCEAVRQRFSRAVRRAGEAMRLQKLMTRRRISTLKQDVIGIHKIQGVDASTIAERLQMREPLVALVLAEAIPLIREFDENKP